MVSARNDISSMPVLLLAAGKGTRLAPLTETLPKCLVPIMGKPLLDYWLEQCLGEKMHPVIVNTHHLAEQVHAHVRATYQPQDVVLVHEPDLLGTGGTVLANRHHFEQGAFMVVHADNLSVFDMQAFIRAHAQRPAGCIITMMVFRTPTPESCGIVELDAQGRVQAFHEKVKNPPGNLANGAVYIMESEALEILAGCGNPHPDISLDLLPVCIGKIATYYNGVYHRDIGTPESYAAAQKDFSIEQVMTGAY